ncbi:protein PLASTID TRANSCRIPTIONALLY ACTIVE 12 isoform X3 [Prunus yedoensis var. nudiflora]|uniref:Protein PLASTID TRANSCRIPTIONALLY ACTIVE 12 isoform X3 n=1 Tax=Prunus yedoensis var. nudiflora TaxID=2094558 RepID=A0A314UZB5_PRUYE|nr:protein PLASTID TRANSCRIPTIONALLY ACTIVE 12 isoform X3 [Prunus yedoensis var. nudiflora]
MAETGQVKLYGEHPTLTETSLYRARRHLFKEERLQAEQEKLDRIRVHLHTIQNGLKHGKETLLEKLFRNILKRLVKMKQPN